MVKKVNKTERRAILEYLTLQRLRDEVEFNTRKIHSPMPVMAFVKTIK